MTTNDALHFAIAESLSTRLASYGLLLLEMVESVHARWSPETPPASTPPAVQRMGNFRNLLTEDP
jgi:hypothetical protein